MTNFRHFIGYAFAGVSIAAAVNHDSTGWFICISLAGVWLALGNLHRNIERIENEMKK